VKMWHFGHVAHCMAIGSEVSKVGVIWSSRY